MNTQTEQLTFYDTKVSVQQRLVIVKCLAV